MRPGVAVGARFGRFGNNVELVQAFAAVAHRRAHAVGSRIPAAEHDNVFVFGVDVLAVFEVGVEQAFGVFVQILNGLMYAVEFAAFDGQVAGFERANAEDDRVVFIEEIFCRQVCANFGIGDKLDARFDHEVNAALHDFFFVEFHVGDAVHEQSANAVRTLVHGDFVPGFVELCGARETCGT